MKKSYYKNVKRSQYGRRNKSYSSSPVYKLLSVMSNPFSTATDQPKVPDGLYVESFGERVNSITTITANPTEGPQHVDFTKGLKIVLSPTIYSPYHVVKRNGLIEVAYGIDKDSQFVLLDSLNDKTWLNPLIRANSMKSMRVVSVGYRIQLMNNADDNEGFFTCGRRSLQTFGNFEEPEVLNGFVCGKLRDIHKYQFNCLPLGRSYSNIPFIHPSIITDNVVPPTDTPAFAHFDQLYQASIGENKHQLGFDNICLKIHGGEFTKIMIYCAFNMEFSVLDNTELRRFMTSCIAAPDIVDKALPRIKRDLRAAIPFTGSFPLA